MKIKLIKNNLFGKYKKIIFKKRFFSEASKLIKYRRFYNIYLLANYNFYINIFYFLKNLEKKLILNYFFKNNLYHHNIVPNFLFKKQIFFDYKNFVKFSKINQFKFLYVSNNEFNKFNYSFYGNNFLIFYNKFFDVKEINSLKNDYAIDIIFKNNINMIDNSFYTVSIISYFLNFNFFLLNILEIYKILILLYLSKFFKS